MTTNEIVAELRDYVTSKPNDTETQSAMVVAMSMIAATLISVRVGSKTDKKSLGQVAQAGMMAMADAAEQIINQSAGMN